MYCTRNVTEDIVWIGGNDRRLPLFEGVYSVPHGVSYNSYFIKDEKTVVFDTVDSAVGKVFFENIEMLLDGKAPDYLVIQHMEPDHSATLKEFLKTYPETTVVCNAKIQTMIKNFAELEPKLQLVAENDTLCTGKHTFKFLMAPMVHWPEVMVTYDESSKVLFSADAFGTFGALNGAIFADEVDFARDYLDEARRYYTNIIGKYGMQVQMLLSKMEKLDIEMICPLHGFVWRKELYSYIEKYKLWSSYTPEEKAVMIAYASIYGNTANAAEIIACRLREAGVKTVMFDVSVSPASDIVSASFKCSHLIFASVTHNAGIFVTMEEVLHDLKAHNIQNRKVALIQNGSWGPMSGKLMRDTLSECKNITIMDETITLTSSLRASQEEEIDALVKAIAADMV